MENPVEPDNLTPAETGEHITIDDVVEREVQRWGSFQDHLEASITAMPGGATLDLTPLTGALWQIRIRSGWPGVDGPGTCAYHLQLGSRLGTDALGESIGPWSETPYGMAFGYEATRVAGAVSALGLDSHPETSANPSAVASGPIGALEIADMAVELLREAFGLEGPSHVRVQGDPYWGFPSIDPAVAPDIPAEWWMSHGFTEEPWQSLDGRRLVGWIDGVLVDVDHDHGSLPGLSVATVRARITDPTAEPLAAPMGPGASYVDRLRAGDGTDVSIDTVQSRGHLVHVWAQRMVIAATDDTAAPDTRGVRDALREVVDFAFSLRMVDPESVRPQRMSFRPGFV